MKLTKYHYILLTIFIITLGSRLFFAFQAENFLPEAYFNIQKTNSLIEEEVSMLTEHIELSAIINFSPLFFYILALFKAIMGAAAFKIIPQIMMASLVIVVYALAKEISQHEHAALFSAFSAGFIPVIFAKTLYNISTYTLVLPLTFFIIYSFLQIGSAKKYVYYFIIFLGILRFTHPSVVLITLAFLVYLVFVKVENVDSSRAETEVILFSTLLIVWSLFINYKQALLIYGPSIIWQNIPAEILSQYFRSTTILNAVSLIGTIPFIFGIYIIYKYAFKQKERKTYALISFCLTLALLLWFRLISVEIGLMFLGVALTVLLAHFYRMALGYVEKTKFSHYKNLFAVALVAALILTSVIPSIVIAKAEQQKTIINSELEALNWIQTNTPASATVVATLDEGFLITTIAQRSNIIDRNFLFIQDASQRLDDVNSLYTSLFTTEVIRLMNKYDANYIYFSERTSQTYKELSYTDDECFTRRFDNGNKIYELSCRLEER